MKNYINNTLFFAAMMLIITVGVLFISSCEKAQLDVQDNFPFEVKALPVPDEIAGGERIEIRLTIKPSGKYSNTHYFIRYFQFDGQGSLQYFDQTPFIPNDLYLVSELQFRLYYTSASSVSQSFDVWISDNFGNEKQLSFQFNSSD